MAADGYILQINYCPDEADASEMLEVVLAGASLMLELDIIFEGPGVAFLEKDAAMRWRQLPDHGLARVWYRGPTVDAGRQVLAARPINEVQLKRLIARRVVIEL